MKVSDMLGALPTLTVEQLNQLKTKVDYQISLRGGVKAPEEDSSDWIFEGIVVALADRGLIVRNGFEQLKQFEGGKPFKHYQSKVRNVRDALLPYLEIEKHRRAECLGLGVRFAEALLHYIGRWKRSDGSSFAIEPRSPLYHIEYLPSAIEAAYPGYLRGGLIWVIVSGNLDDVRIS